MPPVHILKFYIGKIKSEFIGYTGREQATPGFIYHRTVGNFVRQTRITSQTIYIPVSQKIIVCAHFQIGTPAVIWVVVT